MRRWEISWDGTGYHMVICYIAMENHRFNRYIIELNGSELMTKCSSSTFLELQNFDQTTHRNPSVATLPDATDATSSATSVATVPE
jgi:hypothetical protein